MPHLPAKSLLNKETLLPDAAGQSFWLNGSVWQFPTFENADTFVGRLIRDEILVRDSVVNAALQEDVDAIGVSILSGSHNTVFPKILALLKEKGMNDVLLTGGGIIPPDDMKKLNELGVGELFPPGTTTTAIADYIKNWVKENRSF